MAAREAVFSFRRAMIEQRIEELIALLDLIDGDENMEPYLADTFPDAEDRELDDERERDPAEDGIGDEGGLAEQAPERWHFAE
ncbi:MULTISPECIES: hypothetical protein [unclassified Rhizobium]|uniref:hypothetical protein n=1 Tax=unclassified Rhizobium TaxID=2613769 RepID=UPI001FCEA79C|nr:MULTISPECIES: hypothetical protein [unclassified Rhizobium]